jgi:hypothetical protein
MIGTTAALVLGGLAAGGQIGGAAIGSKAAKKASEQQQQAAQQAIAYAEPKYQQALQIAQQQAELGRAGLQPYNLQGQQGLQTGQQGLTALTSLLGLPASANTGMAGAGGVNRAGMPPPGGIPALEAPYTRAGAGGPPGIPTGGVAVPRGTAPTVMLRAPTGQVQAVPADQADFYVARGAQRV